MGHSDFLMRVPTFTDGAARIIDLFGDFDNYNMSSTPQEADTKAFHYDIEALREDARLAFERLQSEATALGK